MNNVSAAVGAVAISAQKDVMGAEIITQTLDTLNQYGSKNSCASTGGDMAASYDFNKSVLSAAYTPTGVVTDLVG